MHCLYNLLFDWLQNRYFEIKPLRFLSTFDRLSKPLMRWSFSWACIFWSKPSLNFLFNSIQRFFKHILKIKSATRKHILSYMYYDPFQNERFFCTDKFHITFICMLYDEPDRSRQDSDFFKMGRIKIYGQIMDSFYCQTKVFSITSLI